MSMAQKMYKLQARPSGREKDLIDGSAEGAAHESAGQASIPRFSLSLFESSMQV